MANHDAFVDLQVKYIEQELEIRVESIKIELEKLFEKLKNDLKSIKMDILK